MANEFDNALKSVATSIAKYVKDASMMQVETRYVEIGGSGPAEFEEARSVARTIIKLDGDSETILPMRKNESGATVVDTELFELHQENVNTAINYRSSILSAMLTTLAERR